MYFQKNYALSIFHELDCRISFQSLKHYLAAHGWKLCFYDCSQFIPHSTAKHDSDSELSIGNQIIQVAKIKEYARSVASFTYLSQQNRAVFINQERHPSATKVNHLITHEIGHIVNEHEPTDCILAKGDCRQENEAKQFSRCLWQLRRSQVFSELLFFHKAMVSILVCCILVLCCFCGAKFSQFFLYQPVKTSPLSCPSAIASPASWAPPSSNTNSDTESSEDAFRPDDASLVYVSNADTVYHLFADCSFIKGRDGVVEIPAAYIGDKSLCTRCKQRYFSE